MCGIIAVVNKKVSPDKRAEALKALRHRGPDADGEWESSSLPVWLGHRRLSIIDLSIAGNQPMTNEDGTLRLVCNGEIYNYPSLRICLEGMGHRFSSNSDSEVILHAYEEWNEDCVEHLEGMFAFVIWDDRKELLVAARDRVGIKPLYYAERGGELYIASEAGALLELLDPKPEPEPMALAYMMTLGYIPSPWSIWEGVNKLEPGCILCKGLENGARIRRWWEPPRHLKPDGNEKPGEWGAMFESVLDEHLLSDVPIGLFLSGGLDSTSVATGLKIIKKPLKALTVSFPESEKDEAPVATAVTKKFQIPHEIISLSAPDVGELLKRVATIYDEPQGYSALISMYLICRSAAEEFKVVLAGDGGDEVFGGYRWYDNLDPSFFGKRKLIEAASSICRTAIRPLIKRDASPKMRNNAAKLFLKSSVLHRHAWRLYPRFLPEEAEALLAPMGINFGEEEMLAPLKKHFESSLPLKRALQRIDLMTFCSDSILAKVDRASMAYSLEVRVPFLDRRIIEWAFPRAVGEDEKKESKSILREYLRPHVPKEVLEHPKQGFSLRVLKDFDMESAIDDIKRGPWVKEGYWSTALKQLLEPGVPYRNARIWNLLMMTEWANVWLEK